MVLVKLKTFAQDHTDDCGEDMLLVPVRNLETHFATFVAPASPNPILPIIQSIFLKQSLTILLQDSRTLRESGGFTTLAVLCLDALSVFGAATAAYIKPPAEKGLLAHAHCFRAF